ncbi:MAG: 30S ribosomal protein S3 [Methanosarcinales archaeon]|nr:30S ribosomal protein S3 [Methanosarcinales archaeon]
MAVERKFVHQGLNRARMNEYFSKQLERAGYAGMQINRTPMGTQITIFAEKPGMVIGKGGKSVRNLTSDLNNFYDLDNPQIDVQGVGVPELNAQLMASRIASALERGWYFRKAAHSTLRRIMGAGALGCRIVLSGKLTGPRSRIEKIVEGYIVHAGKPAEEIVHTGFATAVRKLGTIGCKIQIVLPDTTLPDVFNLVKVEAPEPVVPEPAIPETVAEAPEPTAGPADEMPGLVTTTKPAIKPTAAGVKAPSGMPAGVTETMGAVGAEGSTEVKDSTGTMPAPVETKGLRTEEPTETKTPQTAGKKVETRNVSGFWEHRHDGLDWHVMAIVHKPEEIGEPGEEVRVVGGVTEHKHGRFSYWHPKSRVHKEA